MLSGLATGGTGGRPWVGHDQATAVCFSSAWPSPCPSGSSTTRAVNRRPADDRAAISDVSSTAAQWTITRPTSWLRRQEWRLRGRIADIFGRRRVFLVGVGTFMVSSMLCGLARHRLVAHRRPGPPGWGGGAHGPRRDRPDHDEPSRPNVAGAPSGRSPRRAVGCPGAGAAGGRRQSSRGSGGAGSSSSMFRWPPLVIVLVHAVAAESRDEAVRRVDVRGVVLLTAGLCALVLGLAESSGVGVRLSPHDRPDRRGRCLPRRVSASWRPQSTNRSSTCGSCGIPIVLVASTVGLCNQFVVIAPGPCSPITYFQVQLRGCRRSRRGSCSCRPCCPRRRRRAWPADWPTPWARPFPIVAGMATMAIAMVGVSYGAEHHSYLTMILPMVAFGIGHRSGSSPPTRVRGPGRSGRGAPGGGPPAS